MKINLDFRKVLIIIISIIYQSNITYASPPQEREMNFKKMHEELKDPSGSFRTAPLWVWNTQVTEEDIDKMLNEFKEQGFGGAFVHPRPGLITDYLSDEWFELYRYSLDQGRKLGLDIWIYDENSYPSGFAGGHVPAQMPESYNQGQGLRPDRMSTLPEDKTDYSLILKKEGDAFIDISSSFDDYIDVEGDYYLYKKTYYGKTNWHGGYSYVDLLYPGVTQKFIDITMEGYEKNFCDRLGSEIKGIFTDEPNVSSPGGIRWTPDLFNVFQQQWGYDLKNHMPLLGDTLGNWKQVRHNYMETLTQMFIDRWAKPWFEYTEEKNMYWTGHYWEHGWPDISHGGDNMAMYAWHQMPAIDMLFNQFNDENPQAQFGNVRAVKELSSVANQMGYVRTLSETYGGGGWEVTFEDLKRLGDWQYALGVNFMNQHLSHMTIVGARKYDYPPVFTSVSPWWSNYKYQNDYFARLSLLLSQGEQVNEILVLEPTTTIWLYYSYLNGHPKTMEIGTNFQHFVTQLEKSQIEYDLASENIIKDHGEISNSKFVIGERAYSTVIIPPMTENLNKKTFILLKEFVNAGGNIIALSTPTMVDGVERDDLVSLFTNSSTNISIYPEESIELVINDLSQNGKIKFERLVGNDIYHHRRSYDDGELVFIVNSSLIDTASGEISIVGKEMIEVDGKTGALFSYPFEQQGDLLKSEFKIPPAGSLILFSSKDKEIRYTDKASYAFEEEVKPISPLCVKRMQDNVLAIDFCTLDIDGTAIKNNYNDKNLYTVEASNLLFKHFNMDNPWNSSIQYRQTSVEKDTFKTGPIKVEYSFIIAGEISNKNVKLVAEQPNIWEVRINNIPITPISDESWLDARFGVYEISEHINIGVNNIELSVNPMSIYAEIAPVYILGDFLLESAPRGWLVREADDSINLGSWKKQGHPFYSWDISYSKDYLIEDLSAQHILQLNEWNGTLAEVYVNDKKAGIIAYKPYTFDLSPYLTKGKNTIDIRVVGSLKNLLGPHYNHSVGIAGPWHWNEVHRQDAGEDYNLIDYGLIEDFKISIRK